MSIVERVALGDLPRESGVEMLVEFFQLENERAEAILGAVGNTFSVEKPEPRPFGEPPVPEELDDVPPERVQRAFVTGTYDFYADTPWMPAFAAARVSIRLLAEQSDGSTSSPRTKRPRTGSTREQLLTIGPRPARWWGKRATAGRRI